jgi:RNA polymerase sigma factor (sigma-70 family)
MTEKEAFYRRVQKYRERLLRFLKLNLHSAMRSRLCPEDILSEVTAKCPRNVGEMLKWPPARFCGWLKRVAQRKLCSAYRVHLGASCRSVHRETSLDAAFGSSDSHWKLATGGDDPAAAMLRAELAEQVRASIKRLSRRNRQVVVLRYLHELSPQEAAVQLGISADACRRREYRALLQLRLLLQTSV